MLLWLLRFVLGKELVSYIRKLCDATDPNSAIAVGFIFFLGYLAWLGGYAMHFPEMRSSGLFWGSWGTTVAAVFAAKFGEGRCNKFQQPQ